MQNEKQQQQHQEIAHLFRRLSFCSLGRAFLHTKSMFVSGFFFWCCVFKVKISMVKIGMGKWWKYEYFFYDHKYMAFPWAQYHSCQHFTKIKRTIKICLVRVPGTYTQNVIIPFFLLNTIYAYVRAIENANKARMIYIKKCLSIKEYCFLLHAHGSGLVWVMDILAFRSEIQRHILRCIW